MRGWLIYFTQSRYFYHRSQGWELLCSETVCRGWQQDCGTLSWWTWDDDIYECRWFWKGIPNMDCDNEYDGTSKWGVTSEIVWICFFLLFINWLLLIAIFFLICCHLQTASERVSQMETVWIMMEKLAWNSMNIPQVKQSCGELLN